MASINISLTPTEYSVDGNLVTRQGMIDGKEFIKIIAKKMRLFKEGDVIEELKADIAYKINDKVFRLINSDEYPSERYELTRRAYRENIGIKPYYFFGLKYPTGSFPYSDFVMITEYATPVTVDNISDEMIRDIKDRILRSDLKFHPDFCRKNMVIKDGKIYMIDWDYYYHKKISDLCNNESSFETIMDYRYNHERSSITDSYEFCNRRNRSRSRNRSQNRNRSRSRNRSQNRNRSRSRNRAESYQTRKNRNNSRR